jgi:hypothetical protein
MDHKNSTNGSIETYQIMTSETFVVMLYHIEPSSRIAIIDKTFKPSIPTVSMNLLYVLEEKARQSRRSRSSVVNTPA